MKIPYDGADLQTLKTGLVWEEKGARCLICGQLFSKGEIFPLKGRFFDAGRAAACHVQDAHGGMLEVLLSEEGRTNPFTENQRHLLRLIASGRTDAEIAAETHTALSTVRHQKFVFREKMKQARLVLAVCELALSGAGAEQDAILPPHGGAKMVDDRYLITQAERDKIIAGAFSSLSPLRLKALSPKEKKKIVILGRITQELEPGRRYTEREINQLLGEIYEDFSTLRRYLIEYGFVERTRDCSAYWRSE